MEKSMLLGLVMIVTMAQAVAAEPLNILTTTADLKSIVEFIGGDHVRVTSLGKGTENYHFLAAKPSAMIKANKADLFVRIGFDLEVGYESLLLEGSRNPKIQKGRAGYVDASIGIAPLEVPHVLDRSLGDIHPSGNPHYWLDPLNAKIIANNIADHLSQVDPPNAAMFQDRLGMFNKEIDERMRTWTSLLAPYKGEKIITYHRSWPYFAKRFGIEVVDQLEPKPGIAPSPSHLEKLVERVKKENVRVLLNENIYKPDAAHYVATRTGAHVVIVPNSVGGMEEARDYFSLMDLIIERLVEGWQS